MGISNQEFYNGTQNGFPSDNGIPYNNVWFIFDCYILPIFNILVCIFGILGNGMVIWLLGFHIKRTQFTTYILNLAIADFLLLTASNMFITFESRREFIFSAFVHLFFSFFSISESFLTVISMDRCISIFFPLWYRCHQPKHLSIVVCTLIWVFSFLTPSIISILDITIIWIGGDTLLIIILMVTGVLSLPFLTISSLMLSIKVCCKAKQQHKRKILITILIIVFIFLFLCFPVNVIIMYFLYYWKDGTLMYRAVLCGCLNSSVNPLVYYLVGRRKKRRSNKGMKAALQELFK